MKFYSPLTRKPNSPLFLVLYCVSVFSTPQEAKLDRVSTRLLQVPGLEEGSMHKCTFLGSVALLEKDVFKQLITPHLRGPGIEHITIEDALRIKANTKDRLIEDDLRQYLALCDRLQVGQTQSAI